MDSGPYIVRTPPRKGDGKIAEGQGHSVGKGDTVSLGIFSS